MSERFLKLGFIARQEVFNEKEAGEGTIALRCVVMQISRSRRHNFVAII